LDQQALLGLIEGNQLAGIAAILNGVTNTSGCREIQTGRGRLGIMANRATGRQDGANLFLEELDLFGCLSGKYDREKQ
jgi:hypothetical protein